MKPTEIGQHGEEAVCRYLEERGYVILCRNFRVRGGEIDIAATKGEHLCFVEVKTRSLGAVLPGSDAVDGRKQQRIVRATYPFCEQYGIREEDWYIRYDIAEVTFWRGRILGIEYLENAFDESDMSF